MTFMVNVVAPFITSYRILTEFQPQPTRLINVTSGGHNDHGLDLNPDNYQTALSGDDWSNFKVYMLSKMYMFWFTRGLKYNDLIAETTTVILFCPDFTVTNLVQGMENMKLPNGAGPDSLDSAVHTYEKATQERFLTPGQMPLYYQRDNLKDPKPAALDEQKAKDFFNYIMQIYEQTK